MFAEDEHVGKSVAGQAAQDRAVKDDAAVPDARQLEDEIQQTRPGVFLEEEGRAGPEQAADEDPDGQVLDGFLPDALALAAPAG